LLYLILHLILGTLCSCSRDCAFMITCQNCLILIDHFCNGFKDQFVLLRLDQVGTFLNRIEGRMRTADGVHSWYDRRIWVLHVLHEDIADAELIKVLVVLLLQERLRTRARAGSLV